MAQTAYPPLMSGLLFAPYTPPLPIPSANDYLASILTREAVLTGIFSPVQKAYELLKPAIDTWSNGYVSAVQPSGSFAKGTANVSGTDIDFFLSIRSDVPNTVQEAYDYLANQLRLRGFAPRRQNVSIGLSLGSLSVDLVPARRQNPFCDDHTVFHRRSGSWRKTNIAKHVELVRASGRQDVIRILKLWRNQHGFEFPSFCLELAVIRALEGTRMNLTDSLTLALDYLANKFPAARIVDPANTANIISDDLTAAEKLRIKSEARRALSRPWVSLVH